MWPRETCPGMNGSSILTRNHSPNSRWSVRARQTRDTGAFSSIRFSMTSLMRNLLVAHLGSGSHVVMQPFCCAWSEGPAVDREPSGLQQNFPLRLAVGERLERIGDLFQRIDRVHVGGELSDALQAPAHKTE